MKIGILGEITLETYHSDGLERIKKILTDILAVSENVKLAYLGAGRYKFTIEDYEYKPAEKNLKDIQKLVDDFNDKISKATLERK